MNARQPTRGFTLVELMVVIAIIGLLVTLTIPVVTSAVRLILAAHTERMLHDIGMGLDAFYADFKCYPPSNPADMEYAVTSGAANLALCLHGPVGRGWGTTAGGLMPFGGRALRAYGPYYSPEESLIAYEAADGTTFAGFLDPLEPSGLDPDGKIVGRILYFRSRPFHITILHSDGTKEQRTISAFVYGDNKDNSSVDPTQQAYEGYAGAQHFTASVQSFYTPTVQEEAALAAALSSESLQRSDIVCSGTKQYLLVSPGFDRRYGRMYQSNDGMVPDIAGNTEGAAKDDIQYAR